MRTTNRFAVCVTGFFLCSALLAAAEITVTKWPAEDNTSSRAVVSLSTRDRDVAPLLIETKQTQMDPASKLTESITHGRRNDGSYFVWQTRSIHQRQLGGGITETTTQVAQTDRQGGQRTALRIEETLVKNDLGEQAQAKVYTRDSSGQLVLDAEVSTRTTKTPAGQISTTRIEKETDVNGDLLTKARTEKTAAETDTAEKVTTEKIEAVDHLDGRLKVMAEKTTTVRAEADKTFTEVAVRRPTRTGVTVTERTTTTEVRAPDGSVQRQIIEHGRSLFSRATGEDIGERLLPRRKIIEREVRQPDGTFAIQRDVYRRDVNGDWKKETFSTYGAEIPGPGR